MKSTGLVSTDSCPLPWSGPASCAIPFQNMEGEMIAIAALLLQ
jgi:hypothetical protein